MPPQRPMVRGLVSQTNRALAIPTQLGGLLRCSTFQAAVGSQLPQSNPIGTAEFCPPPLSPRDPFGWLFSFS
jgi:hypothetical protein